MALDCLVPLALPCRGAGAPADALVLLSSGAARGLDAECRKYVSDNGGRVESTSAHGIFTGYVPAALEGELAGRCGAALYREEIADPESLRAAYGGAGVTAAKAWNNNLQLTTPPQTSEADKHLQVVLETDGAKFTLVSEKVIAKSRPVNYSRPLEGTYYIEAVDSSGKTVSVQSQNDPTQRFYDYFEDPEPQQAGGAAQGHKVMKGGSYKADKGEMTLNLPYGADIKTLRISRRKAAGKRKFRTSGNGSVVPATTDLELKSVVELGTVTEESR